MLNVMRRSNLIRAVAKRVVSEKTRKNYADYLQRKVPVKLYFNNNTSLIDYDNKIIHGLIPVVYWDTEPNFGDLIGPYLISKITGKAVLNIKDLPFSGFMAVGSILHMINRDNMVVWGSGLIEKPTNNIIENLNKYRPKILSVRGHNTAMFLSKAGIDVPNKDAYGDPALILPLFYEPKVQDNKKIGICPHFSHKQYFLDNSVSNDKVSIIDVQKDMETVVDAICSSQVCISTSLHGLIVAQAYNIPWVWLEIADNNLRGDEFKFQDFFSTIEILQVTHIKATMEEIKDLDFEAIALSATVPKKLYNEASILDVFKKYIELND